MNINIIKELHRISNELADMIVQEQDDEANGFLVDMYDAAGSALKRLNEKVCAEFQNDNPPNAMPVPMDFNG